MTTDVPLCDDAAVAEVAQTPGATASEIAAAIGVDRLVVVGLLHEHFDECLFQDHRYRWWPRFHSAVQRSAATDGIGGGGAGAPLDLAMDHRDLAAYYLEAVIADSRDTVNVYASSNAPAYVAVDRHPVADETYAIPRDGYANFANRAHRERKRLSVGGPIYAQHLVSKKGNNFFVLKPLFTWTIQPGVGMIEIVQSSIAVNADALAAMTGARRADPEQIVSLQTSLGLDHPEQLPPFDEVMARLVSLNPSWPWAETMDPSQLGTEPSMDRLRRPTESGIYNRVILCAVDGPTYTRGLETELAAISEASPDSIDGTALGRVVAVPETRSIGESSTDPLIEPLALNAEQRDAVRAALGNELTVVTGPPGTGKSQVVSSIIVNAAFRGQSVLFASKNNKAVDVVEARVNGLSKRPALLRLGRQHLNSLASYLTSLLSMPATQSAVAAHTTAIQRLGAVDGRIENIEASIQDTVSARNIVAELDGAADVARSALPESVVAAPDSIDIAGSRDVAARFQFLAQRADRARQSGPTRMVWFALRSGRQKALEEAIPDVSAVATAVGVTMPPALPDSAAADDTADRIGGRLDLLKSLQVFTSASAELASAPRIEELYSRRAELVQERSSASLEVWDTWVATLRSGISPAQQNDLGSLKSVVVNLAEGKWTPATANRFQKLFASVQRFLPAWAITSLSVRGRVPLSAGLFDLVVIDEASQCDIASALPLLYRAKRAVIIGDPMQLRHISGLAVAEDEAIRTRHGIKEAIEWSYATESLYDLGARVADSTIFLRDHHRSDRDVIEFSNREFYDSQLRVATRYDRLVRPDPPTAVRWIPVAGSFEQPGGSGGRNDPEARAVVGELARLETQDYQGTIGIVTPFRSQANLIRQLAQSELNAAFRLQAQLDIGTAHTFQGDERDVMIYSPVITDGASRGAKWFVGEQNRNLFNVAITRARSALIVVGDRGSDALAEIATMGRFIKYVDSLAPGAQPRLEEIEDLGERYPEHLKGARVSTWEHSLYEALHADGILATPQVEVDAYRLDLGLFDGDRKLDIEVDGERFHAAWDGDYVYRDRLRNLRLLELGWDVMRFWVWETRDDLDGCVNRVRSWLSDA